MFPREAVAIAAEAGRAAEEALASLIAAQTKLREAHVALAGITSTPPRNLELATTRFQGADEKLEKLRGQVTGGHDALATYMVHIEAIRAQLDGRE